MQSRWASARRLAVVRLDQLRGQRFFHDYISVALLMGCCLLNATTWFELIARLHPIDYLVPTHFSNITGFDTLQSWPSFYRIGAFSLGVTLVNAALAMQAFNRSRITSFFLLAGAFVVSLFCLAVASAFLSFIQT